MNVLLKSMLHAAADTLDLPGPVVEIGSYQVDGQQQIIDLRGLFPRQDYLGLDFRPGPGVDVAADVEMLPLPDASVGTLVAISTFEHVRRFWKGFREARRVLRPDGVLVVSVPFYFYLHNYPGDYWRFSPQALDVLLEGTGRRIIGWHGREKRPENVWALAWNTGGPSHDSFHAFHARMKTLVARSADSRPWRNARYRAASLLVGRGPFADWFDRNRWHMELR